MKYCLMLEGLAPDRVRRDFGHDLQKLWGDHRLGRYRGWASHHAPRAWKAAQESGKFEDDFAGDPMNVVNDHIRSLAELHGRESDHVLRYPSVRDTKVPVPLLLLDVFEPIVDVYLEPYLRGDDPGSVTDPPDASLAP